MADTNVCRAASTTPFVSTMRELISRILSIWVKEPSHHRGVSSSSLGFFWRIAFFALATSVFAGERLNSLVSAAQNFSVAIQEQLAAVQGDISATQLVEKTVSYAKAKTAYFNALRAEIPEMTNIATGR